jgi:quercetin dioxygenase-like cupin family protein
MNNTELVLQELSENTPAMVHKEVKTEETPYRLTLAEFEALRVSNEVRQNRQRIYDLQESIAALPSEQVMKSGHAAFQTHDYFTRGIYVRELPMKKGHLIVSERHAQEHIVVISKGSALVFTEHGMEELHAPHTFVSPAGEKRVVLNLEDSVWLTIHRTELTDPVAAKADLIINESGRLLNNEEVV